MVEPLTSVSPRMKLKSRSGKKVEFVARTGKRIVSKWVMSVRSIQLIDCVLLGTVSSCRSVVRCSTVLQTGGIQYVRRCRDEQSSKSTTSSRSHTTLRKADLVHVAGRIRLKSEAARTTPTPEPCVSTVLPKLVGSHLAPASWRSAQIHDNSGSKRSRRQ